jgi:hypothetical protein
MKTLSRRTFLAGTAGVAVSLPLLDAMVPARGRAQLPAPYRYVVSFGGVPLQAATTQHPSSTGALTTMGQTFAPLEALGLIGDVTLVSGLTIPTENRNEDVPPGGRKQSQHGRELSPLLSGVRSQEPAPLYRGATSDQIVAERLAAPTRFSSVQLRVQPEGYLFGAQKGVMSARASGGGVVPLDPIANPVVAYDQLFGGGLATSPGSPGTPSEALARDRSVLDLVRDSAQSLLGRLGPADRVRLDQHFEEIRAIERRLTTIPGTPMTPAGTSCEAPARPTEPSTSTFVAPSGQFVGWSGEDVRADVLAEITAVAFACDLTRVVSWMISFDQAGISSRHIIGRDENFHQVGHNGVRDEKVQIAAWHAAQWGKLVRALKDRTEEGEPLLHRTFLALMYGESPSAHGSFDMTVAVAGRPDVLRMGQHLAGGDQHPAKVLIAGMQAVGVDTDTLGEVSGAFTPLQR